MAKRLSQKQKEEIVNSFINGISVEQLSNQFACTKLTISRNLKQNLGEKKYKDLIVKSNSSKKSNFKKETKLNRVTEDESFLDSAFLEIPPLNYEIENAPQKDLSSIPISEINFPNTVFMVVDKNIELETKYLKDYPEWEFLPENDLNRKTIEIFDDIKIARNFCKKEQKVIKVPNTEVFRIVAPILLSKGISRIVSSNQLIAL